MKTKNIVLICRNLSEIVGGVERTVCLLGNLYQEHGNYVTIVTWDDSAITPHYTVNEGIKLIPLKLGPNNKPHGLVERLHRARHLSRIISILKPDYLFCFQSGVLKAVLVSLLFCSSFRGIRIISCMRNSPQRFDFSKKLGEVFFTKIAHLFVSKITIQIECYRNFFWKITRNKCVVIPNFTELAVRGRVGAKLNDKIRFLFVGRLGFQKNFDEVYRMYSLIHSYLIKKGKNTHLIVCGQIEDNFQIQNYPKAKFLGIQKDLTKIYDESDFLLIYSRWEGLPNVFVEALTRGVPTITSSQLYGLNQLVLDLNCGIVIDDDEQFEKKLLESVYNYNYYTTNCYKRTEIFNKKNVQKKWLDIIS